MAVLGLLQRNLTFACSGIAGRRSDPTLYSQVKWNQTNQGQSRMLPTVVAQNMKAESTRWCTTMTNL